MALPPDRHVRIGVHWVEGDIAGTLRAVHEATASRFDIVVLKDPEPGAEEAADIALAGLARIPLCAVPPPGGAPAAFNQLVGSPADVYVFLEAGARPGPGWIERLLDVLDIDPAHGLAGPSTTHCWTGQGVAAPRDATSDSLRRQAAALLDARGRAWRSMAPLYGLSDVCLAVRAEVVAAVGAADEAYGRGPCWEMDYAARAARAGFDSVWAEAAWVHRGALPRSRIAAESRLIEINKRLYQDRFCGRRRRSGGDAAPYRDHCRGADCPAFAPVEAIRLHRPLPSPAAETQAATADPLISCIMPTRRRPAFVAQAIAYFRRQDYPARELVIVCRDEDDLPGPVEEPAVRVVRTTETSIGAMRNVAVGAARGEIVAHWDDDDWYGRRRLSRQAAPILQGLAEVTGLNDTLFLALRRGEFWQATPDLYARMFVENVAGGSMMFRRELWERSGPYPDISLREDAVLLERAVADGARLCRLPGRDDYVYVRHGRNTWTFQEGRFLAPGQWTRTVAPAAFLADRPFYSEADETGPKAPAAVADDELISCIMPTRNRRAFLPGAIAQFLRQDHRRRELIIVDDGEDAVDDLVPPDPSIRYVRIDGPRSIGAKRNLACGIAQGRVLAHWDDDDWRAPQWLSTQLATLTGQGADLCGLDRHFYYDPVRRAAWRYVYDGARPWVGGGTLCYTRAFWESGPFPDTSHGEDNAFVWGASGRRMAVNPRHELYVAVIHPGNTSPKVTAHRRWHPVSPHLVERLMADDGASAAAPRPRIRRCAS